MRFFTSFMSTFTFIFVTYNLGILECKGKTFVKNLIIVYLLVCIVCFHFEILILPLFFIVMMVLLFFENKCITKNFISLAFSIIIFLLSDTIQGSIFMKVFYNYAEDILDKDIILLLMHISLFCIAFIGSFLISCAIKKFKVDLKRVNTNDRFFRLILLNTGVTALIFYITTMMIKYAKLDNLAISVDEILFSLYFFLVITITYILTIYLKEEVQLKNKRIEFNNLQEYTSNLESMYNDMRKFRHDYINILSSMTGYIEHKDLNGLEIFFNKKILKLGENILEKNCKIDKLQNVKITELKGLLSSKVIRAQELCIDVFIDIMEPIEHINIDAIDICKCIGILLDNSIEAALECKTPSLKIGIINKKNSIMIIIINSCLEKNPPIYQMFEKGFSTKGANRGLGLSNLKEVIDNYHNVFLDTKIINEEFIQNLQILK